MNEKMGFYQNQLNTVRIKFGRIIRKRICFNYREIISETRNLIFDLEKIIREALASPLLNTEEKSEIESSVFELLDIITQSRELIDAVYQLQMLTSDKTEVQAGVI